MKNYPSVVYKTLTFKTTILSPVVPIISDYNYTVN